MDRQTDRIAMAKTH